MKSCLVNSTLLGPGTAESVNGSNDVSTLVASLAKVDQGIHLSEGVVVASQIKALGIVGLDSWEVAVKVGQLVLGGQDGLSGNSILGDVRDNVTGDTNEDLTFGKKGVKLSDGLKFGLSCSGPLNLLLENGPRNLKFKISI